MSISGALIGGGISALGSIIGGNSQASAQAAANVQSRAWQLEDQAKAYRQSDPRRQRRRLEKAGFNPLPYLQGSAGIGAQNTVRAQAPISNGVSQAGAAIAEAFSEDRVAKFATAELELENRRLDELVKAAKLKERVPGIYGRRNQNTQVAAPDNGAAERLVQSTGDTRDALAPGRDAKVTPLTSGSGLTVIDNVLTEGPIVVPGEDGEPWGWDEIANVAIFGTPQIITRKLAERPAQYRETYEWARKNHSRYRNAHKSSPITETMWPFHDMQRRIKKPQSRFRQ